MPRRRRAKKRRRVRGIPVAPLLGVVTAFTTPWEAYKDLLRGDLSIYIDKVMAGLTGYSPVVNKDWDASRLLQGWGPIVFTMFIHKIANFIGINRLLSRYRIPIRI